MRIALISAAVAATGAPVAEVHGPEDGRARQLVRRVPAVVAAVLEHPLGATSLAGLGAGGRERSFVHARWANELTAGSARPDARIGAAEDCLAGAVLAWSRDPRPDPTDLSAALLAVLPDCRPDGVRAAVPGADHRAGDLVAQLLLEGDLS